MRALVVYESMFGNTRDIASAVADGLRTAGDVETVEVGVAPSRPPADVDLLVVGGPTHAFGMTRASTRADAARQAGGAVVSAGIGVREWLDGVGALPPGLAVAAFDTRVARPQVPGSAARAMHRRLRHLGATPVVPARSFWVAGTRGPLEPDERERARAWGAEVGRLVGRADGWDATAPGAVPIG
jgi:hypothetical protein